MITKILKGLGEVLLGILGFVIALGLLFFGAVFTLIFIGIIGLILICCPWLIILAVAILIITD